MVDSRSAAPDLTGQDGRLIVASNRLPLVLEKGDDGWEATPGSGGLVTAMSPLLREHGGTWVGWPGTVDVSRDEVEEITSSLVAPEGYDFVPVPLSRDDRDDYYYGFCNEVLWPLLHDLQSKFRFAPEYWHAYRRVNRTFARILHEVAGEDDFVWAHDYHLMEVGKALRAEGYKGRLGYFLHTPFPPVDILLKLPWRTEILEALLHFDLLGFQTLRDRRNFLAGLRRVLREVRLQGLHEVVTCRWNGRSTRIGAFPIGIDFQEFVDPATSEEVRHLRRQLRDNLSDRRLVLAVSRLDYTKGIPNQLRAFRTLLERSPGLRETVSLVQVVVPSREHIPEYDELKEEIERRVGEINGRFGTGGWVPVHFLYRSLPRPELVAYYREADVALAAPLKDGMNLIAKEYCAASVDEDGVLVLSEFAGAADQLRDGALLVNPYDTLEVAKTVVRALEMDERERHERMRDLREVVHREDIHWWLQRFARATQEEGEDGPLQLSSQVSGSPLDTP